MLGCTFPKALGLFFSASLLLASAAFAQTSSAPTLAGERTLCVGSFAAEKLWYWQRRLKLQDWKVTVVVARATELKPRTLGNIHWDTTTKTAVLRVLMQPTMSSSGRHV